jgi:predicted RNase H-like HicB family nuclease
MTEVVFSLGIVVERDDDRFHAYSPSLKGLHVQGNTEQEALQNALDAAEGYLLSLMNHGDPIPLGVDMAHTTTCSSETITPTRHKVAVAV